jgi:hypothetical protein
LVALLRKRSKAAQDESHLRAESHLKRMRLDAGSKPVEGQASFQTGEDKGSPHDFQAGFQEVDNACEPAVKAQPGRKLFFWICFVEQQVLRLRFKHWVVKHWDWII